MSHGEEGQMKGRTDGVDLYSQATKLLSVRPPRFEGEEAAKNDTHLPVAVTQFLDKHLDGKGKPPRRSESEASNNPPAPSTSQKSTVWDQTEEYFRPLTLSDLENLFPKLSVESTSLDSCLFIPPVGTPARDFSADAGLVSVPVSLSSVPAEELVKNSVDTNKDAMDIDEVGTTQPVSKPSQKQEEEEDDVSSLHWMLGSQERFTLTSERPNKKHKLLGQEAGLERVLLLPRSDDQPGTSASCDVCCTGETNPKSNRLLQCNSCKIFVHQKCYGVSAHDTPVNQPWLCTECRTKDGKSKACILCPKEGRVLKPVGNGTGLFAHLFCSLWAPEVYVRDVKLMEPVMNMESVNSMRKKLVCNVCKVKHGACVRCSHGTCRTSFHPICAREAKHQMEIWAKSKTDNVELRAFCSKHSAIQELPPEPKVNPPEPKVNPPPPQEDQNVIVRKVPLLRFTRKNKTGSKGTVASNPDKSVSKDNNSVAKEQGKDADVDSGNLTPNSPDFALRLKKMIDGGKISVVDLASEVGISSESLEAALVGETTMFSPGLKMKIIKWIQKQNKRADKADPASADVESLVVKSQPPRQRTKSLMVLQDDKQDKQDSDSKPAEDVTATPVTETAKGEDQDQDRAVDVKVEELPQPAEKPTEKVENESSETQQNVDVTDGVVSMDHDLCKDDDNANVTSRASENGFCDNFVPSGEGSTSTSYVHPIIRRKLMDLKDPNSKQKKSEQALSDVPDSVEEQLSKARSLGLLDMAPQDELEGELIYLQSKLLDNQLDVKHKCEELLEKVVHEIPKESESVSRRKWDLVVVSHFLRDVREVKKRGRKERKHREAQAVMAEATAAVSASVRRKDTKDDNQQQQPTPSNKDKELKSRTKDSTRSKASSSDKNAGNQFQIPILSRDNTLCCDVCLRSETVLNRIFVCSVCKTMVHLDCYRSVWNPAGPWKCELCEEMSESLTGTSSSELGEKKVGFGVKCALCGNSCGAFRKTSEGLWVHAFCAEWLLESVFRRGQGDLVHGLDTLLKDKDTCCICFSKIGSCLKCSYGECLITFHPWCGRAAGFYMNASGLGGFFQHKAYCAQHSTDQKLADDQQYGPEEIKCLKQTRVELEKLRLLCERIIKREKLKRDLVQCSNQILGKRKDCIVSTGSQSHVPSRSGHTRSGSHIPPGSHMSSESATTSINNRSSYNSRTVQQSPDDVTIDSSVSRGRNTVRFSLNPNRERETMDDSSTSPQGSSFKRKMVDRGPFAGKTVPQRGGAVPPPNPSSNPSKPSSQTSADDGDRKSKQGQLVMTSDQATAQNQRLPKGFAYVPIGSLAKDKPRDNSTAGPRDSEEPGG
ncbi:hypothetical protein LUZ60_001301 [Juncus effusus]|nr:hypothetical protein LUZ60_001301 [Juncus effusus]